MTIATRKLFQPLKIGDITLKHRVALAPLTRFRANSEHVHGNLAVEYYKQRSSTPGTLLITEATFIAEKAGLYAHVPGIYSDDQIAAWKKVTDAVHANGSFVFLQLWALGRAADTTELKKANPAHPYVSASDVILPDRAEQGAPRPLTKSEISEYVQLYATASKNAVHKAGFDGVEIHGANGYLVDQFIQDTSNKRTDEYGGSVENRSRFALEVIKAVTSAVGEKKTGIRFSPWSKFQGMGMEDPKPTFSHLVTQIRDKYPEFAYVHLVEPLNAEMNASTNPEQSNDFIREIWAPRPLLTAGGLTSETVIDVAEKTGNIMVMGRYFISNPDLPRRIRDGIAWSPYNRKTFYTAESPVGYTDYPTADSVTGRL